MNKHLSTRIEAVEREQRRKDVEAVAAMTDEELAARAAEGTRYTAEQVFAFTDEENRAFMTEQGTAWILDLSDEELERLKFAP